MPAPLLQINAVSQAFLTLPQGKQTVCTVTLSSCGMFLPHQICRKAGRAIALHPTRSLRPHTLMGGSDAMRVLQARSFKIPGLAVLAVKHHAPFRPRCTPADRFDP